MNAPVIEAHDVHRRYGSGKTAYDAVRGVDFTVAQGEVFALLGTNGAGKTSTMELAEGLAPPTKGSIRVFGKDPVKQRTQVRPYLGVMLQDGGLPQDLTVEETLTMWRGTCSRPLPVGEVLEQVGLTHRLDVRVAALSGGEQRRLDLACALVGDPQVLFLDEPTTGLDPESRRNSWRLLADLKARGVTMVLTTHYLEEVEELADHMVIMHAGSVRTRGTLAQVVAAKPATIRFRRPQLALPQIPGAQIITAGDQVTIETRQLQRDLYHVVGWAEHRGIELTGLDARAATLESVFVDIARGDGDGDDRAHPSETTHAEGIHA